MTRSFYSVNKDTAEKSRIYQEELPAMLKIQGFILCSAIIVSISVCLLASLQEVPINPTPAEERRAVINCEKNPALMGCGDPSYY